MEDFFLYLREGEGGLNRFAYQSLQRIKNKDSFKTWLLNTFRNYLSNRAQTEENLCRLSDNAVDEAASSVATDEQKIAVASQLIAYAHQVFYPRGRFIFLRSLLTMLNKQKALPNEEVAKVLGMTNISYRVTVHRMKCNLKKFRHRLLQGEELRMDDAHQQMVRHICDDFCDLYSILLSYYSQSIDSLKCADAIKRLRQQYYEATGVMAHEPDPNHIIRTNIKAIWNKLNLAFNAL